MQEGEKMWVWFSALKGISLVDKHKLLKQYKSVEVIYALSQLEIEEYINKKTSLALSYCVDSATEACAIWMAGDEKRSIVSWPDEQYPSMLRHIHASPLVLYIEGDAASINTHQVAMVGSRKCSVYGKKVALEFAKTFSRLGITVTSGLAIGIDGYAHEGALSAEASTVAVLANGLDQIYPKRHAKLAEKIVKQGCLVSEFPIGMPPLKNNFPRRNRIIAGLALGVIVVEAQKRSGTLITARLANEQGKQVFAIPGSIYTPQASGCHALIDQGAKIVMSVDDVLAEFNVEYGVAELDVEEKATNLDKSEATILNLLGGEPISSEEIIIESGLTSEQVSAMLLNLELKGHIVRDGLGLFNRC